MGTEDIELSLILPAYNERGSIAATIEQAFAYFRERRIPVEIIVAADGNDGTREVVREMSARLPSLKVIGRERRSGKGRGVREAVSIARGRIIGFADADNKVPIEEYAKIEYWLERGYEVVAGSRALEQSKIERRQPWYRRLGSSGFAVFMRMLIDVPVRDTQCGFKFFHRTAALRLFRLQRIDGYMFDIEILALAGQMNYGVKEVPICWRDDADSRLQLFSGNLRNLVDVFRIRRYVSQFNDEAAAALIATEEADR